MWIPGAIGDVMGDVAMTFKLMPSGVDVDFNRIKEDIKSNLPQNAGLKKLTEVPIAFGLKALEVQVILDDKKGGGDEIERILGDIQDINSVDLIDMGLL